MSRRNDDQFDEDEFEEPEFDDTIFDDSEPTPQRTGKHNARRRRWPYVLLVLLVAIFLLPNLIGWLGLQQTAINYALSDFNGEISVEKVSLGWLQPIKLTNVSAKDTNGNSLFNVESVTSTNSLYSFAMSNDYGQFEVVKPVAYIQLRPDGSNLEDALANYIAQPIDPNAVPDPDVPASSPLPKLNLNITEGQAIVSTTSSTQTWQIDGLNAITQISAEEAPLIVDAQCRITPVVLDANGQAALQTTGGMVLAARVDRGQKVISFGSADILVEAENIPVSIAAPVLQRFVGPANTTGTLNGKIQAAYDGPSNSVAVDVQQLNLDGFGIVAPELIGSDQLVVETLTANGIVQISPSIVAAQQFKVQSDVGDVIANGSFDLDQLTNLASGGQLLDTPFQMDGELDIAKLVRMLPSTLQLHKDLIISSGTVTFNAASENENGTRRMVVNLDTANVKARRGAQNINWAQPLRLVGTVRESQGTLELEEFRCESDFLTVAGSANMQTGSFIAKGDLNKLVERVSQFVDLEGTRIAGTLDGKFGWQVQPTGSQTSPLDGTSDLPIQIGGSFVVTNPLVEFAGMPRWQQKQMSVKLSAAGSSSTSQLQLDQGGIQVDVGSERMVATLAQPVADAYTTKVWNADCTMTGTMAGWLGHVRNFVDLGNIDARGQLTLDCDAAYDFQTLRLSTIQYTVDQLAFDGYSMKIREQKATGTGALVYDLVTGSVLIPETTLAGSSLSARGQQLEITFPSNMQATGNIVFRADVNRIADWFELSPSQDSVFWYGAMDGTVKLASNEDGIGGRVNATITDLVAAQQVQASTQAQPNGTSQVIQASQPTRQWQEIWREPKVDLTGDLSLANDFNAVGFKNVAVDSSSLRVTGGGSVADLAGAMIADISGTWRPSWQQINSLMAAYTGGLIKFAGQGEQQFVVRGPIFDTTSRPGEPQPWVAPELQAYADFGWDQGEILGLGVGASKLEMKVNQSIANVTTTGIPFAGGVIRMAPSVDLRGPSPLLVMNQTRIIDNVRLEQETARQWLKYVAPLAADATSAQGNFTVDVGKARVPIFDPMTMEVEGAVTLSNVVIGAGPTAEQLLATVKQIRTLLKPNASDRDLNTWLKLSEQTVPVIVKNGRVHHDKVRLSHKDLTVQTSGSVGFDQTLNMVAEIPIADDWIAGNKYLASLKGKSITIPVGGTVSKPVLDKRAIQSLSQDLLRQAAGSVINDKVNQYQGELNNKLKAEGNKIFGKLGIPSGRAAQPGQATPKQPGLQQKLENRAKDELIKGFGNLFGK